MKKTILLIFSLMLFQSCTSQNYLDQNTVNQLVESSNFTFMAQRASPSNFDVINVMNSLPGSTTSRVMDLSYGYTITFKDKEMTVTLPYYGRNFTGGSTYGNDNSFRFTSKDYTVSHTAGKKNKILLQVKPNDVRNINMIYFDISPNGKAYVSVNANDRTPISYDGYIMRNETVN